MLEPPVIVVVDHRPAIDRVLEYYGLPPDALELVPSVFEWCQAKGLVERHKRRMAKCFCNWDTSDCHIVMCESFSQRAFENAKASLLCNGFASEVEALTTPTKNLLHLLLHEIACHTLRTYDQHPRDAWAFTEMSKHDI